MLADLRFDTSPTYHKNIFVPDDNEPYIYLHGVNCDIRIFSKKYMLEPDGSGVSTKTQTINGLKWSSSLNKGSGIRNILNSPFANWSTLYDNITFRISTDYGFRNECFSIVKGFTFYKDIGSEEMQARNSAEKYVQKNFDPNFIFLSGTFIKDSYVSGEKIVKSRIPTQNALLVFGDKDLYYGEAPYQRTLVYMKKGATGWVFEEKVNNPQEYIWN